MRSAFKQSAASGCGTHSQPLVTFALFAYNQENYIREAVEGAFSQTYSRLEIILSDDCSSDETFRIMGEMASSYRGPHRIVLNRNEKNLGMGRHYSKVMEMASGEFVALAAGDDISLPDRIVQMVRVFEGLPNVSCVSFGIIPFKDTRPSEMVVGSETIKKITLRHFATDSGCHPNAPARGFRKHAHDYFGPLSPDCPVEDTPNLLRCLLHGDCLFVSTPSVLYRIHGGNMYASENKFNIRYEHIHEEYKNTIRIANEKGLIDGVTGKWLNSQMERRYLRRLVRLKLMKPKTFLGKVGAIVVFLIPSRHFSVSEKIVYLVKSLGRSVRDRLLGVYGRCSLVRKFLHESF